MARSTSQCVWLAQVPSPAQAAKVGWHVWWFIKDPLVDQLASCTCGLLRLGVKRFHRALYFCASKPSRSRGESSSNDAVPHEDDSKEEEKDA